MTRRIPMHKIYLKQVHYSMIQDDLEHGKSVELYTDKEEKKINIKLIMETYGDRVIPYHEDNRIKGQMILEHNKDYLNVAELMDELHKTELFEKNDLPQDENKGDIYYFRGDSSVIKYTLINTPKSEENIAHIEINTEGYPAKKLESMIEGMYEIVKTIMKNEFKQTPLKYHPSE